MSRKGKRKSKGRTSRRSATAVQVQAKAAANPLERMLDDADDQSSLHTALELYQTVLDQCQDVSTVYSDAADHAWDVQPAACYLRAVFGVATSLWRLNRTEEAARHFEEVLEADPADAFFARYWLAACLLGAGRLEELKPLVDRYDEPSAFWRNVQALWAFASIGDRDESCRLVREAHGLDARFVEYYLLGDGVVFADRSVRFDRRRDYTHSTARLLLPVWRSIPGAASWARRVLRVPLGRSNADLPFPRQQLLDLPQREASWQVALRKMEPEQAGEEPCWMLGVADMRHKEMRCLTVIDRNPTPEIVWREMLAAFVQPIDGHPQRPLRLEVPQPEFRRAWRKSLSEVNIECRVNYNMQQVGQFLDGMAHILAAQQLPRLNNDFDARDLPLGDATWQVDFFHQPTIVSNEQDGTRRPWSVVVMDRSSGHVLCTEWIDGVPHAQQLWECAARLMRKVSERPRRIEVSDSDGYDFLRPTLAAADIECVLLDELPQLHSYCLELAQSMSDPGKCALADGQGVDRDAMESFYYAAAGYFRQAPWKQVPGEIPIKISVAGFPPRYAIVLGRTGVTLGLVVHESLQGAIGMVQGRVSTEDMSGYAVIFEEEAILASPDVYLIGRHGWPIASPEAYPAAMRFRPGNMPASPSVDDLEFLTACLHCLPDFVSGTAQTRTYSLSDSGPPRETHVSWPSTNPLRQLRNEPAQRLALSVRPERPSRSVRVADAAAVQYVNRKRQTYYLHQGRTKTCKPKYFFSRKPDGDLCDRVPEGHEIYESPRGQVFCRRIQPKLIMDQEVALVREAISKCGKAMWAQVDVKGKDVIVYEREEPCLKFSLWDDDKRLFGTMRWCYLGSIDDWISVGRGGRPLSELAERFCRHIGEESFFELM